MRYSLIAAALVGAVAAAPSWAPPAYGGEEGHDEGSWGSASTVDQTTVITVTSCAATVTDCPGNAPPTGYPVTTPVESIPPPVETSPVTEIPPPATYPGEAPPPAETPYSPEQPSSPVESIPPPASETPYSPEQPSSPVEVPPPATYETAPPASETPYSPIGGSAPPPPPAYPTGAVPPPAYPIPGNGTYSPSGTASGAPSASSGYPVQQTGNTAAGVKAGSFIAGLGAFAALLL